MTTPRRRPRVDLPKVYGWRVRRGFHRHRGITAKEEETSAWICLLAPPPGSTEMTESGRGHP